MIRTQEATGKTVDEARAKACALLGVQALARASSTVLPVDSCVRIITVYLPCYCLSCLSSSLSGTVRSSL